jgi:hypothetical protein
MEGGGAGPAEGDMRKDGGYGMGVMPDVETGEWRMGTEEIMAEEMVGTMRILSGMREIPSRLDPSDGSLPSFSSMLGNTNTLSSSQCIGCENSFPFSPLILFNGNSFEGEAAVQAATTSEKQPGNQGQGSDAGEQQGWCLQALLPNKREELF